MQRLTNMSMLSKSLLSFSIFLAYTMSALTAMGGDASPFSPISLAFSCGESTKVSDKLNLKPMSPAYDGSLASVECADKDKMISTIIPEKISIIEHKNIGTWTVVIFFNGRDTARIAALTRSPAQQRYFLIVKDKVLASSFLTQQIQGEFGLDADSREQADQLKRIFAAAGR